MLPSNHQFDRTRRLGLGLPGNELVKGTVNF